MRYELKLRGTRRIAEADGATPEDAARNHVAQHPEDIVIATRPANPVVILEFDDHRQIERTIKP